MNVLAGVRISFKDNCKVDLSKETLTTEAALSFKSVFLVGWIVLNKVKAVLV